MTYMPDSHLDPEPGFDPGPDHEEEIPWDADNGLPLDPDLSDDDE